jgi:hypothetical protein
MVCATCAEQLQQGPASEGRGIRLFKALLFGCGAGLAGAIGYSLTITFAHLELALITILIGWLVGTAVMKGSEMRGGRGYQILSAALTYGWCMMSYVPTIVQGSQEAKEPLGIAFSILISPFIALALPFTGAMGILGTLILGFGVWRGFRIPQARHIDVTGPLRWHRPLPHRQQLKPLTAPPDASV